MGGEFMNVESASVKLDLTDKEREEQMKKTRRKQLRNYFRQNWQLYVLLIVPLAFALTFKYAPLSGLVLAFKDYKIARGIWGSEWVGFQVFQDIFAHRDFIRALRNTVLLNSLDLIFSFTAPIFLALLLNEIRHSGYKRVNQSLLYLPHLGGDRVPFLQSDYHWLASYVGIGVWASMGWGTIIYLAAISGVNPELYEAATVDGAGRWRKMWNVTLPSIRPTIITLLILNLGRIMGGSFEQIFALQNKATNEFTTTIPVLVYRWGIESGDFSRATAVGLFQSVVGLILILIADRIAKKLGEDGLL
jgi:putative aldouronate transport system permease protein